MLELWMLGIVIGLSLIFTFTIGFQDGSAITSSALAARALTRKNALLLVSVFEFLGALCGGSAVASTVQSITSWPARPDLLAVLASSLCAAISWNLLARRFGLPSSGTHALIGGLIGATIAGAGSVNYLVWTPPDSLPGTAGISKVLISLVAAPFISFFTAKLLFDLLAFLLRKASSSANGTLKSLQWIAVPALAFGNGTNATQTVMGIIMLALVATGHEQTREIPLWVRLATATAMVTGIVSLAPKIVKRLMSIYKQRPIHGLASEASSALVVIGASMAGGPLSTSQVVSSSIVGVGAAERLKGVQWQQAGYLVKTWLFTVPGAAIIASLYYLCIFSFISPGLR